MFKIALTLALGLMVCLAMLPAYGQTLSEIYVTESGNVMGAMIQFNPGYPSFAFVKSSGILLWIAMQIPEAIIEIHSTGYVHLVERTSGTISYYNGRISRIGDTSFEYENTRISRIGGLRFFYDNWRISRVGEMPVVIEDGFLRSLGGIRFGYRNGIIQSIDELLFTFESGRIQRIGDVWFDYDVGVLKKVSGSLPGVSLKVTSTLDVRRSFMPNEESRSPRSVP